MRQHQPLMVRHADDLEIPPGLVAQADRVVE